MASGRQTGRARVGRSLKQDLEKKYSPEQIAGRLCVEFPDDPEMWVSAQDHRPNAVTTRSVCSGHRFNRPEQDDHTDQDTDHQ